MYNRPPKLLRRAHVLYVKALRLQCSMSTVLPGDLVSTGGRSVGSVGPGVHWEDDEGARANVAGFLRETEGHKIWVDFNRKRVTMSFIETFYQP